MRTPQAPVHVIRDLDRAAALLHPIRLRILGLLAEPGSAAGLARTLGLPRQRLNYHVRRLEDEGLIREVGRQKKRNCTERLVQASARSYVISPALLGDLSRSATLQVEAVAVAPDARPAFEAEVRAAVVEVVARYRAQGAAGRPSLSVVTALYPAWPGGVSAG